MLVEQKRLEHDLGVERGRSGLAELRATSAAQAYPTEAPRVASLEKSLDAERGRTANLMQEISTLKQRLQSAAPPAAGGLAAVPQHAATSAAAAKEVVEVRSALEAERRKVAELQNENRALQASAAVHASAPVAATAATASAPGAAGRAVCLKAERLTVADLQRRIAEAENSNLVLTMAAGMAAAGAAAARETKERLEKVAREAHAQANEQEVVTAALAAQLVRYALAEHWASQPHDALADGAVRHAHAWEVVDH